MAIHERPKKGLRLQLTLVSAVFLSFFIANVIATTPAFAQKQSYPMACRGGGGMLVDITQHAKRIVISFRAARTAARTRQPGAGECAWLDRPLRPNEPKRLTFWGNRNSISLSLSSDRRLRSLRVRGDSRSRQWNDLFQSVMSGRVFYVHAFNERKEGVLAITRMGR